jgi:hypothetical protein
MPTKIISPQAKHIEVTDENFHNAEVPTQRTKSAQFQTKSG